MRVCEWRNRCCVGTTGGLGGEFVVVTNAGDYDPSNGEPVIAGSLRAAIPKAGQSKTKAWIVFRVGKIVVNAPFRLPDNVALDGSCSDVMLESPVNVRQVYVFGRKRVIGHRCGPSRFSPSTVSHSGRASSRGLSLI